MSAAKATREQTEAYQQTIDEVLRALDADAQNGLSEEEARARVEKYGKNELRAEKPLLAWLCP